MAGDEKPMNANIIVDLDVILDTRLPVVYAISKSIAENILINDMYRKRVKDVFGTIPYSVFKSFYNRRDKPILELATPTPMFELVIDYCIEAYGSAVATSTKIVPTLYLNTYPYDLNRVEQTNLIKLLDSMIPVDFNIEMLYLDTTDLTPKLVLSTASTVIKYDMVTWLEYHSAKGNLSNCPLIEVSCIGPMIANGTKPTKELTQDDFDGLRATLGPFTNLVLLQSRMFSSV